jgi:hypothetical protein
MFNRVFRTYTQGWNFSCSASSIGKDLSRTVFLGLSVGCFVKAGISVIEARQDKSDQELRKERLAMVVFLHRACL